MTTRSNRSAAGHRPQAGEVTGQKSFWFLLGRLPKETRPASPKGVGETPLAFIREADVTSAIDLKVALSARRRATKQPRTPIPSTLRKTENSPRHPERTR
jgi:hypothetical protein